MRPSLISALGLALPVAAFNPFQIGNVHCYSGVYVMSARGTGQERDNSSLIPIGDAIVSRIPDSFYTEISYPADFQFIKSSLVGIYNMTEQLITYNFNCPNSKIALLGYSQGSAIIDIVLAGADLGQLNNTDLSSFIPPGTNLTGLNLPAISQNIGSNIVAVVMYGDGTNVPGQGLQPDCNACKSNGTLQIRIGENYQNMEKYSNRLLDFCDGSDPICCTTGDNPRAHLSYFNNASIEFATDFVVQKYYQFASNGTSPASSVSTTLPTTCVSLFPSGTSSTSASATGASATGSSPSSSPTKSSATMISLSHSSFAVLALGLLVAVL